MATRKFLQHCDLFITQVYSLLTLVYHVYQQSNDYWMGYHGRDSRARFTLDWNTGEVSISGVEKAENGDNDGGDDTDTTGDVGGDDTDTTVETMSGAAVQQGMVSVAALAFTLVQLYL